MNKPERLKKGDRVAIVSLSSGMMGEDMFIHRFRLAKERLERDYGLIAEAMPNALKGIEYLAKHPEKRAQDLMDAFKNKEIKAIFSAIGGAGGLEILPYVDFEVIRANPKIFTGFSDTTSHHFMMHKAGLISYYGLSVMDNLGEYGEINPYTRSMLENILIKPANELRIEASAYRSDDLHRLSWSEENIKLKREVFKNNGYELIQGNGVVEGELLGGCIELLMKLMDTSLWPNIEEWKNKILLIETYNQSFDELKASLRALNKIHIFDVIKGIIVGRPSQDDRYEGYKAIYKEVIGKEANRQEMPILYNVNVGHAYPIGLLGLGLRYEIDCNNIALTLKEPGTK